MQGCEVFLHKKLLLTIRIHNDPHVHDPKIIHDYLQPEGQVAQQVHL